MQNHTACIKLLSVYAAYIHRHWKLYFALIIDDCGYIYISDSDIKTNEDVKLEKIYEELSFQI